MVFAEITVMTLTIFSVITNYSTLASYVQPWNSKEPRFDSSTLRFVSVIARHGSRSDFSSFPTDPHPPENITFWPFGPGELTKLGRQQAYTLGRNLRQRYGGFLGELYSAKEAIFKSNLNSRDLMSAQLIAAGMYPPVGHEIWNDTWPHWQPVEVWPASFDTDDPKVVCPAFKKLMTAIIDAVTDEIYAENKELVEFLVEMTGFEFSHVKRRIKDVYDPIFFEKQNGVPTPVWVNDSILTKLSEMSSKVFVAETTGTPKQLQLNSGPIVRILLEQLSDATGEKKTKLIVMTGHDSTIIVVKFAFGITDYSIPNPASYLAVELHNDGTDFFVQMVLFNDSAATVPTVLEMPECPHPCKFDQYAAIGKRMIIDNWDKECQGTSGSSAIKVSIAAIIVKVIYSLLL